MNFLLISTDGLQSSSLKWVGV